MVPRVLRALMALSVLLAPRAMSGRKGSKEFRALRVIRVPLAGSARKASRVLPARRANRVLRALKGRRAFQVCRVRRELRVFLWTFRAQSRRMRICRRPLRRVTPMLLLRTGNFTFMTARRGLLMAAVCRSKGRLVRREFRGRRV